MGEWYYTTNNQQMGPVSWDELRQLASTGLLHPTDMVWKEGMADWVKATRTDGLFSERAAPRRAEVEEDQPRRRSRERDRDRDYDDDYEDRPRRRRRRSSEGMPLGAKVAIIGGSIAVGVLIVVVVIVLLVRGSRGGGAAVGPGGYVVTLLPGREDTRFFQFQAGQNVRISVSNQLANPNTDVDLFVSRNNGFAVAADTRIPMQTRDCFVQFVAPATEAYRVTLRNLGPGVATSTVNFQ